MEGLERKIFVAEYQLHLPTQEQIVNALSSNVNLHLASKKISKRQEFSLQKLKDLPHFQVHEYKNIANISLSTAQRDLQLLVHQGVVEKKGRGKNTYYTMINAESQIN
ncbi:hypothetical protein TI05_04465 [Achromatium sp. WMS3]|nr:hypothetical protein TI05_04465 [Achromatium sp. WMS3]